MQLKRRQCWAGYLSKSKRVEGQELIPAALLMLSSYFHISFRLPLLFGLFHSDNSSKVQKILSRYLAAEVRQVIDYV